MTFYVVYWMFARGSGYFGECCAPLSLSLSCRVSVDCSSSTSISISHRLCTFQKNGNSIDVLHCFRTKCDRVECKFSIFLSFWRHNPLQTERNDTETATRTVKCAFRFFLVFFHLTHTNNYQIHRRGLTLWNDRMHSCNAQIVVNAIFI